MRTPTRCRWRSATTASTCSPSPAASAIRVAPGWRSYFRSTLGHNTLELDGENQSRPDGPFLWTRYARSRVVVAHAQPGGVSRWRTEHDGYGRCGRTSCTAHQSSSTPEPASSEWRTRSTVRGGTWAGSPSTSARRSWWTSTGGGCCCGGRDQTAVLELPGDLVWNAHRSDVDPPLG